MTFILFILAALFSGALSEDVAQSPENTVHVCYQNAVTFSDTCYGELQYPGLGESAKACSCRATPEGGGSSSVFLRVTLLRTVTRTGAASCNSRVQAFTPSKTFRLLCSYAEGAFFDLPMNQYKRMVFIQELATMKVKFSVIGAANVTVSCIGEPLPSQGSSTTNAVSPSSGTTLTTKTPSPTTQSTRITPSKASQTTAKTTGPTASTPSPTTKSTGPTPSTPSLSTKSIGPTPSTPSPTTNSTGPTPSTPSPTTKNTGPTPFTPLPTTESTGPTPSTPSPTTKSIGPTPSTPSPTTKSIGPTPSTPSPTTKSIGPTPSTPSPTTKSTSQTTSKPSPSTKFTEARQNATTSRHERTTSTPTSTTSPPSKCPVHGEMKEKLIFNTVFEELYQKYFKVCTCKTFKSEDNLIYRKSERKDVFSMNSGKFTDLILLNILLKEFGE